MANASLAMVLAVCLSGASALRRGKQNKHDCYSPYDGKQLVQLRSSSAAERAQIMSNLTSLSCVDMSENVGDESQAICDHEAAAMLLKQYGGNAKVVEQDAGAFLRGESGVPQAFDASDVSIKDAFFSDWRDTDARLARVIAAVDGSQGVATWERIGTTIENRPIMAVRMRGSGWSHGGGRIVVVFQVHAREWITGMAAVYTVENVISRAIGDSTWLAGMELVMVPVGNPDGTRWSETSERMFRKNRRVNSGSSCMGVDLNRQFPPGWGGSYSTSTNPCSDVFYGSAALSEPEAQAIADLIDESPANIFLDVHSYGQLLIAPFGYTNTPHPRRAELDVPGRAMTDAIYATHGREYSYGGNEVLYPASGLIQDYVRSDDGFGYTFELRPINQWGSGGFAPPASDILPCAEEFLSALYAAVNWVQDPAAPTPPPPTPAPPTPAPTPAPPPGTWVLTGSGCQFDKSDSNCIHSLNYPSNYGNNEECEVELSVVPLAVDGDFMTEYFYDKLTLSGVEYHGAPPRNLADLDGVHSGTMTWTSDVSTTNKGWRLCRTD